MSSAAIQVPCFFLLCALFWKLGALAINNWVLAVAKGFADITAELRSQGRRLDRIEEHLEIDSDDDAPAPIVGAR